ncbi:transglycosylase [Dictyobacter alpinus]|uniref:Transglycosylase n=1 Tax=Dictyobacter alpinus TaxID=2014873 RepID=A0A402BKK8_9CHLR|nr:GlsB/YeaQ/YmgE family stress response membrane protein [Dictyobacter alpinus]GCE31898.1 transglycosylase [Dictyobacter alpinus]
MSIVLGATLQPGNIIAWVIIGLVAGWLAGVVMPGKGYGIIGDLILGLVGALIGGFVVGLISPDATFGFWGSLVVAFIASCALVAILHAVMGRRTV